MESSSMGLLRRPTTSEIVEDGRFSRPYGPGALRAQLEKTNLRLRRHSHFSQDVFCQLPEAPTIQTLALRPVELSNPAIVH
jgi:hypothetical protein